MTVSAAATPAPFSVRDLRFSYKDRKVLDGVTLSVERGEIFGLLGPNGSGKSTLLGVAAGLSPHQQGELLFDGEAVSVVGREQRARIAVVFQRPALDERLSASQNLALAARLRGLSGAYAKQRIAAALRDAELESRAGDKVKTFSGGMRRRLDIARALLDEPDLLLLDEPTSGLDEAAYRRTWQQIEAERSRRDLTVLVTTHRHDEAARCDRLAVLSQGRVEVIDTPAALCASLSPDVVVLDCADPEDAAKRLAEALEVEPRRGADDTLLIECEAGHELILRVVEVLPKDSLRSLSLRHASLADVFFKITGTALDPAQTDGEEAS